MVKRIGRSDQGSPCRAVFITGGTGSVGAALVHAFSSSQYRVYFQFHRDRATARDLKEHLGAVPIRLDFERDFVLPHIEFDVVINNAGLNITDKISHKVTLADWNRTLRVNLTAPFLVVRQYLPSMIRKGWGRIINVSSIYGLRAVEGNFPYTVSKHGLSGLTKTIAKEYARYGITCNEICPGPIDSDMMTRIAKRAGGGDPKSARRYINEVCEEIPAGRMLKPGELAELTLFLASDKAGYLTGASIPMDGGMIA